MHIAPHIIHAASGAAHCVRSSVGSIAVCCTLLGGVVAPALAGPGPGDAPGQGAMQSQRKDEAQHITSFQGAQRPSDGRPAEGRPDDARRGFQQDTRSRNGRLTPDERRDLRRQINEAGQDIYANPPRR